ncbi:MAG: glycosyltransferase [Gemmatimonadaceae bacterium]|nr:glycosyltransferase [Chitinophagaceae bacterium]
MSVRISVITICFNNLAELLSTCVSVDAQDLLPYEHWIIDGSTNGDIRNYLETHDQPPYRKWVSERDSGIADAFNKGVMRSAGDVINMLNSADTYFDSGVLKIVAEQFEMNPQMMWLHGKYQLQRRGVWVTIGKPFEAGKLYRGMRSLSHQSMFVRRGLHDRFGLYDLSLKNAMDYDFVCRISVESFHFMSQPLVIFAPGGVTDSNYLRSLSETKSVYKKHFGGTLMLEIWQARLKFLHYILKSPIGGALYKLKVWVKLENA